MQLKDEKGGSIEVKALLGLANLVFLVWFVYFLVEVSDKLNVWPF